jgi:hypothetical protein
VNAYSRVVYSEDNSRVIGVIVSSPLGWRAIAVAGSTPEDINAVMDVCEPLFARIIEARRGARVARRGKALRLVTG